MSDIRIRKDDELNPGGQPIDQDELVIPPEAVTRLERILAGLDFNQPGSWSGAARQLAELRKTAGYPVFLAIVRQRVDEVLATRILDLFEHEDSSVRLEAVMLLRGITSPAIKDRLLSRAMVEADSFVRSAMIINIGNSGETSDLRLIQEFLSDDDDRVRANTLEALGKVNDTRIIGLIAPFLRDENNRVKANAVKLLYRFEKMDMVFGTVKEMLRSDDERMHRSAVYLLKELDTVRILDLIFSEDAESFLADKEKKLALLQNVEILERLERNIAGSEERVDNLEREFSQFSSQLPDEMSRLIKSLIDAKAGHASLITHRIHYPTISRSLEKQIEIEALNAQLETSRREILVAQERLEKLNSDLEILVDQKTQALKESMEFIESIIHSTSSGVIVVDPDLLVSQINAAATRILHLNGRPRGLNIQLFAQFERFVPIFRKILKEHCTIEREEIHVMTDEGYSVIIGLNASPLMDRSGKVQGVVSVFQDITRMKALEAKMIQSEKMMTIGSLSSYVAHEFNNRILGILGFSSLILAGEINDPELKENLEMIHTSARSAKDLVKPLLSISRSHEPVKLPVQLDELIADTIQVLRPSLPPEITIRVDVEENLDPVPADRSQLDQLLLNLLINARDSIEGRGWIQLTARSLALTNAEMTNRFGETYGGRFVELIVSDNGSGMDEDVRAAMFDPFFTTKPAGKGTGLGCTIIYNVVRKHGGQIEVNSQPGEGTTIRVLLPAPSLEYIEPLPTESRKNYQGLTALVIEDEPIARAFMKNTLKAVGFEVIAMESGEQVVEQFGSRDADGWPPGLILSDMLLPDMDGLRCYEILKDRHGSMPPIIFTSGHYSRSSFEKVTTAGHGDFLQKPFTTEELLALIDGLLSSTERP